MTSGAAIDALRALDRVRPTNWADDDDAEQKAAWEALDAALAEEKVRSLAAAAAHQAVIAAAELLRFAKEGPWSLTAEEGIDAFEEEAIEKLADACKMAIEIEDPNLVDEDRGQLYAALCRYLEGWVG